MSNVKVFILSFLISFATLCCYAKESEKTLLIFGAKWCKFCSVAKKDMEKDKELSEIIKQFTIIDVDIDDDKEIVDGHNVKNVPTFIIFQDGKEVKRQTGYTGPKKLINFLK